MQEKTAGEVMTNIDKAYMLDISTVLDHKMLREIYQKGFSRIPIYDNYKNNIVGVLMTRDLIMVNPDKGLITLRQLSSLVVGDVIVVDINSKVEPLLGVFKKG